MLGRLLRRLLGGGFRLFLGDIPRKLTVKVVLAVTRAVANLGDVALAAFVVKLFQHGNCAVDVLGQCVVALGAVATVDRKLVVEQLQLIVGQGQRFADKPLESLRTVLFDVFVGV